MSTLESQTQPEHATITGALFDFIGYLTSRKTRVVLSAYDDASPAVDALRDFAMKRGLSLDDAQVREWVLKEKKTGYLHECPLIDESGL